MLQLFRKRLSNRKGFTLVELLVVISIIGILSAIAIPKFESANKSARGAKIQADLRTIDSAIQIYYASAGSYPSTVAVLSGAGMLAAEPTAPVGDWATRKATGSVASGTTTYSITSGRAALGSSTVENF